MTAASSPPPDRVAFGPFVADLRSGQLWRDGEAVAVQDLPFRMLTALLERPGEVVSRSELVARLWGSETFVDGEAGLNTAAAKLRQALRLDSETALIETVPKRGYRFTGQIVTASAPVIAVPLSPGPRTAGWPRIVRPLAFVAVVLVLAAIAFRFTLATPSPLRIGVVLFDNETGLSDLDAFAQRLTDTTVAALAQNPALEVIGNAAVLRSNRPFRDIEKIRDAIDADYVVVGQVQNPDRRVRVVTHLIRTRDQAHVWIKVIPGADRSDADIERNVSDEVAAATALRLVNGDR